MLRFRYCYVVEERDDYYAIYNYNIHKRLLTHKSTWKQATKIASLLQEAYDAGYLDGVSW